MQLPMIIHTLFDRYNFRGKTITPFTTSAESPMSASMPYIRDMARPYNATVLNGFRYDGNNTALRNWLQGLNLIK
ncbi:flavodoxin [Lactobacillus crispatus]